MEHRSGAVQLWAVDLGDPAPIAAPFEGSLQLTAILYASALPSLGLDPGLVAETDASRPPPPWLAAYRRSLDAGAQWTALDAGASLEHIRLPIRTGACRSFTAEEVTLESVSRILFGIPAGDRTILATASAPEASLWIAGASGASRLEIVPPPAAAFVSGFASGGSIILADATGTIWRGSLDIARLALEPIATHPDGAFRWIGGTEDEMLILREDGRLDAYDGAFATGLLDVRGFDGRIVDASIASVRPGEIVLAASELYGSPYEAAIYIRYAGGRTAREHPIKSTVGLSVTAHVEGVGDVVGSGSGHIAIFTGGEWVQLDVPTTTRVNAIAPHGAGFLYGGEEGTLIEFAPSIGLCPAAYANGDFPIEVIAPLTDAVLLARNRVPPGAPALLVLR